MGTVAAEHQQTRASARQEALTRAVSGHSVSNYPAIYQGFMARGIPQSSLALNLLKILALPTSIALTLHKGARQNAMTEPLLTPAQVAERLQVKPSWVYEQTRDRASVRSADPLPHLNAGRYLRFRWSEIEAWLDRQREARAA